MPIYIANFLNLILGYGRLPDKHYSNMTQDDWKRKEMICRQLLETYGLTEAKYSLIKGNHKNSTFL